jgi:predicted nucleic acid-binding Zn ribbon protein
MPSHTDVATSQEQTERAALVVSGGLVLASPRPCPVCGQAMTGRKTSACSDRCRAAKSRRSAAARIERRGQEVSELVRRLAAIVALGVT